MDKVIESVRERCVIHSKADGGCWEWRLGVTSNGVTPKMRYEGNMRPVRRVVAHRLGKLPLKWDYKVALPGCDNPKCVNPDHILVTTISRKLRWIHGTGRRPPDTPIKMARIKQASGKLTAERVRELRQSKLPAKHYAALWGVDASTINRARRGESWKTLPGDVWRGL